MIGVALTTRNRPEVLKKSLHHHKKHLPKDAKLVVVDDASDKMVRNADYRFKHNAGIAAAKNKCLELLEGCEHIFLFDDDTYPVVDDWYLPYIQSGIKHLSFTFPRLVSGRKNGRTIIKTENGLTEYGSPCGCMLYIYREAIDTIGGFDVDYPIWGMEHVDFSNRCFNAGLTPKRYLDVNNSLQLFHSLDYHQEVSGSVPKGTRKLTTPENKRRFAANAKSKAYMPYKNSTKGILFASYFNSNPDPQRKVKWDSDISNLDALIKSCEANGVDYLIFHDCFDIKDKRFIKVPKQNLYAPNVWRWFVYHNWLKGNHYDNIFMVDSTDVEVLRNPFVSLNPNKIYVGDEVGMMVNNIWMRKRQEPHLSTLKDYKHIISLNSRNKLLNCGIVGGSYDMVMEYLEHRVEIHEQHTKGTLESTDMAVFNYIMYKYLKGLNTSGLKVNTGFKRNEYNSVSFFKHK